MATKTTVRSTALNADVEVQGGKTIIADNKLSGFKEDERITVFKNNETCEVEFLDKTSATKKHVKPGTKAVMHVLDAAVAEKMGKVKILRVLPINENTD